MPNNLIYGSDNDIDEKYVSVPMRLFLVDGDGKTAYAGDKGPFGWGDEGFENTLKTLIT